MLRFSLRFALAAAAAVAVFGGACGDAQEGHGRRGGPPSVFQPISPVIARPFAEAPPPPRSGPGAKGTASDITPASAPTSVAGQTARKVDPPARFAGAVTAQNAARADAGLKPLIWSTAREDEAQAAVNSVAGQTCSRALAERMGAAKDVSAYWAPSIRQLDGSNAVQQLSSSFIVSEWLQERSHYSTTSGCDRKGACENYSRLIRPAGRTVGCSVAICPDQSQVWACRYGD